MYCPNCGKKIPDSAKFCPYCGSTMNHRSAQNTESAIPRQQSPTPSWRMEDPDPYHQPFSERSNANRSAFSQNENWTQQKKTSYSFPAQDDRFQQESTILALLHRGFLGAVGGVVMLIGAFLPVVSVSVSLVGFHASFNYFNYPESGSNRTALIIAGVILLALAAGIILCSGFQKKVGAVILAIIGTLYTLFAAIIWNYAYDGLMTGPGPVVAFIGAIVSIFGSFLIKRRRRYM